MKYSLLHVQNRIDFLKRKPVENAKIIKKWQRIERKLLDTSS